MTEVEAEAVSVAPGAVGVAAARIEVGATAKTAVAVSAEMRPASAVAVRDARASTARVAGRAGGTAAGPE